MKSFSRILMYISVTILYILFFAYPIFITTFFILDKGFSGGIYLILSPLFLVVFLYFFSVEFPGFVLKKQIDREIVIFHKINNSFVLVDLYSFLYPLLLIIVSIIIKASIWKIEFLLTVIVEYTIRSVISVWYENFRK